MKIPRSLSPIVVYHAQHVPTWPGTLWEDEAQGMLILHGAHQFVQNKAGSLVI